MSSRKVRCSCCGVQLIVPPRAQNIQCAVCKAVTQIQQDDPLSQAQNSIQDAAIKFKGFLNRVSSNINSMVASVNSHPLPGTSNYSSFLQPVRPMPSLMPTSAKGRKRAVLCGVSYLGQSYRLKGSVNDVKCMKYFLIERMGFPNDSILLLSEEESNPALIPTKYNIRNALQWLIQGCQSGDSLVFHYSGHGSQQRDSNGDEIDGYDEMLWPVDHQIEGTILDDEINATIVKPLPRGAKLHAIIDACHSGTILDLPFLCRMNRGGYYVWEDHRFLSAMYKGTSGGLAISFSACDDNQVSVDTTALSGNVVTGAMTYSFIQAAQQEPGLTYGRLLNAMRYIIRDAKAGISLNAPISTLITKLLHTELSQVPQLSSSEKFDIYSKSFCM